MQLQVTRIFYIFPFLLLLLQGCVATQSFPDVARAGDTITLAVGSPDGMSRANTAATYISDVDGSIINLPVRAVIRIRPDPTSKVALFNSSVDVEDTFTAHSQWLSIVVIDLPAVLPVGTGVVQISTTASYGTFSKGINETPVALEIIDGIGRRNDFNYTNGFGSSDTGDLASLEALSQVVFQPPNLGWTTDINFGAAEIKIKVPMQTKAGGTVPLRAIRVVADDYYTKNSKDQLSMSWSKVNDIFTVNFVSPTATMEPLQLRFSVVLNTGNDFIVAPGPEIISARFFDIDGNLMTVSGDGIPPLSDYTIGIQ